MPGQPPRRILSLDGGGSWGALEVRALQELYGAGARGREVLGRFDLVAANSAGALILAALAEDLTLSEVAGIFASEAQRRRVFARGEGPAWLNPVRWAVGGPRYSTRRKAEGLAALLPRCGATPLASLPGLIGGRQPRLLVVGFDYDDERAVFFRSDPASRAASARPRGAVTLLEAVHASSNAPVLYFDRPVEIGAGEALRRLWDGGVAGYNNPVLAAVVEALACWGPGAPLSILSLGAGMVRRPRAGAQAEPPLAAPRREPGEVEDLKKLAGAIIDDPPDAATFIAWVLLGQRLPAQPGERVEQGCLVRMSPVVSPARAGAGWRLPPGTGFSLEEFGRLATLDTDAVAEEQFRLVARLADEWVAGVFRNQAVRFGPDLECEVGQPTFAAARQAWEALAPE